MKARPGIMDISEAIGVDCRINITVHMSVENEIMSKIEIQVGITITADSSVIQTVSVIDGMDKVQS